jgi:hypothetical protein
LEIPAAHWPKVLATGDAPVKVDALATPAPAWAALKPRLAALPVKLEFCEP